MPCSTSTAFFARQRFLFTATSICVTRWRVLDVMSGCCIEMAVAFSTTPSAWLLGGFSVARGGARTPVLRRVIQSALAPSRAPRGMLISWVGSGVLLFNRLAGRHLGSSIHVPVALRALGDRVTYCPARCELPPCPRPGRSQVTCLLRTLQLQARGRPVACYPRVYSLRPYLCRISSGPSDRAL